MSFAPKDEREAHVRFALERGIPAILNVMGTKRLPYSVFRYLLYNSFLIWRHILRHILGGKLLLELNGVLQPGGYFVWSATPVYQKLPVDVNIWQEMSLLKKSLCWDLVAIKKDKLKCVGAAIYPEPASNDCYSKRSRNVPPLCEEPDDRNAAWNAPLQECLHKVPVNSTECGSVWPAQLPEWLEQPPYWLNYQVGVYGKAAQEDFTADNYHWKTVVSQLYLNGMGINWSLGGMSWI